jgi:hypothetical protein
MAGVLAPELARFASTLFEQTIETLYILRRYEESIRCSLTVSLGLLGTSNVFSASFTGKKPASKGTQLAL